MRNTDRYNYCNLNRGVSTKCVYILLFFMLSSTQVVAQNSFKFFWQPDEPENVEELTKSLTASIADDSTKVVAIYKWITNNVSYDYSAFMSGEPLRYQSPELVFRRRKTTCTGYSNLMVEMLENAGIRAFTVEGFTQDFVLGLDSSRLSSDHAWVAFALRDSWYVADPTWDAGEMGILKYVQKDKIKHSFFKRLFSFKLKKIFTSKKKRQIQNKTYTRERITYKIGFNRLPTMDYLFADPDEFLKSHLPNVAHIQMKTLPVTVEQFCDSIHSVGDLHYTQEGNFDYNALNNRYYEMQEPDRMLWLADSSLQFHHLNHGDKAINYHNYLAYFNGGRSNSKYILEKFKSICDTVVLHGNEAIAINKKELKRKKSEFSKAFSQEKIYSASQNQHSQFIRSRLSANTEIYRKGRERIVNKELVTIRKIQNNILSKYSSGHTIDLKELSSNEEIASMINPICSLLDSINKFQVIENPEISILNSSMKDLIVSTQENLRLGTELMNSGFFMNEYQLLATDQQIQQSLHNLNVFLRDNLNSYLSNRKSYTYLLKLDQEVKRTCHKLDELYQSKRIEDPTTIKSALNTHLMELALKEERLTKEKLTNSTLLENEIRDTYFVKFKDLSLDLKDLNNIRTLRQAYLTKMMNNKYNRSIKVYSILISNANKWKRDINTRLTNL